MYVMLQTATAFHFVGLGIPARYRLPLLLTTGFLPYETEQKAAYNTGCLSHLRDLYIHHSYKLI